MKRSSSQTFLHDSRFAGLPKSTLAGLLLRHPVRYSFALEKLAVLGQSVRRSLRLGKYLPDFQLWLSMSAVNLSSLGHRSNRICWWSPGPRLGGKLCTEAVAVKPAQPHPKNNQDTTGVSSIRGKQLSCLSHGI